MSLELIIRALIGVYSPQEIEGFRQSAPEYLTYDTAKQHLEDASLASWFFNIDKNLILYTAGHESNYTSTITKEIGGKVSCGVMTPVPTLDMNECAVARSSYINGYMKGTAHMKGWFDACHGDSTCAIRGYAGGYVLIRACKSGAVTVVRSGHKVNLCDIDLIFKAGARRIARYRTKLLS